MWKLELFILILNLLTVNLIEGCSKKCREYYYESFTDLSEYITNFRDGRKLNNLAIAGTHDSVNCHIASHRTQDTDLSDQLVNGIRSFEFGLHVDESNKLKVHTNLHDLKMTFEEVIITIRAFLKKNPGEIVFSSLYSVNSSVTSFCPTLDDYLRANDDLLVQNWSLNDTIEMHRGKMLLVTIGDRAFSQCVKDLKPECRLSTQGRVSIFGEPKIQAKQRELRRSQEASFSEDYQCFISFLSGDYMDRTYEMAVKGTKQCDEPINHFMADYFDNSHRGLIILRGDFMTAELIKKVYHSNMIDRSTFIREKKDEDMHEKNKEWILLEDFVYLSYVSYQESFALKNGGKLTRGKDFTFIAWDQQTVNLDDIVLPYHLAITGARLKPWRRRRFRQPKGSQWFTVRNTPTPLPEYSQQSLASTEGNYTLPLFDLRPVSFTPSFPLGGVGIYLKHGEDYGEILALKVFNIDIRPHLDPVLSDEKLETYEDAYIPDDEDEDEDEDEDD
ncbi:hypothetical protein KQX54_003219 [Cotesia glomerata]|uniref:Uncharacterized protein n=1 Tax=Cotesia glomerata TaxID=32391 RepID=A0AAV7IB07_COTGL|nr:hypothetical protein KQX54_003219 [Cotesia glomerata]